METIVQPEEEWDMLEASKINNKRTPKSIKDNEQEDEPHLLNPEPQAHRTVTMSPPSACEYRCYTLRVASDDMTLKQTSLSQRLPLVKRPETRSSNDLPRMDNLFKVSDVFGSPPAVVAQLVESLANPSPGGLVASHLVKVDNPMLLPHKHCFFAFGTTVLGTDGPTALPFAHQGHAFQQLGPNQCKS